MNRLSVILGLIQMVWQVIINVDRDIIHPLVLKWREEEAKKKNGGGGSAAGGAAAALVLACVLFSSCAYVKQGVSLLDDYLQSTQTTTNTPTPASTNLPATPTLPPPMPTISITYIPGDERDNGTEIALVGVGGFEDVRYSANDVQNLRRQSPSIPTEGAWYPLDPDVVTGLSLHIQPDGSILCQAADFTSSRTGLRYRFCGDFHALQNERNSASRCCSSASIRVFPYSSISANIFSRSCPSNSDITTTARKWA